MHTPLKILGKLDWIALSAEFFKNHFFTVFGLGLLAAFGRAAQLRAFGPVSDAANLLLEMGVEAVRVLIFLYALGLTNVRNGAIRVLRLFTTGGNRRRHWRTAVQKLKSQWVAVVLNLVAFLMVAWAVNALIDYAAYQTCLYAKMKATDVISDTTSEWAFILFLKNISIIPFTLVFNALFLLWVTNRLHGRLAPHTNHH
ncbi:MAG TPA: hypothetical protein VF646_10055 [Cytophagales bacterium]